MLENFRANVLKNGIGSITSRWSGKEPALVDRTLETGGNRA